MKNRNVLSEKEKLSKKVKQLAKECKSLGELSNELSKNDLEPYYRGGRLTGLWFGNRKFRLITLGIGKEHLKELTIEQNRLNSLQNLKNGNDRDLEP